MSSHNTASTTKNRLRFTIFLVPTFGFQKLLIRLIVKWKSCRYYQLLIATPWLRYLRILDDLNNEIYQHSPLLRQYHPYCYRNIKFQAINHLRAKLRFSDHCLLCVLVSMLFCEQTYQSLGSRSPIWPRGLSYQNGRKQLDWRTLTIIETPTAASWWAAPVISGHYIRFLSNK